SSAIEGRRSRRGLGAAEMSWPVLVDFIPELILLGTALVVLLGGLFLEPIRVPLGAGRRQRGDEATFTGGQGARVFASAVGLTGSMASLVSLYFQVSRTGSRL